MENEKIKQGKMRRCVGVWELSARGRIEDENKKHFAGLLDGVYDVGDCTV